MKQDPLAEQIRLCQQGDAEAFGWLNREYGPRLYRYFLRLNGSAADAEDMLQELFVKLIEKISHYRHEGRFEGWLFCVAANMVRDEARRRSRRGEVVSLQDERTALKEVLASDEATAPEKLQQSEQIDQLQNALEELPGMDREIIMLRYYGQMSFKEIAEQFEIPIGTALAKVHRGLKRLQKIMLENEQRGQNHESK